MQRQTNLNNRDVAQQRRCAAPEYRLGLRHIFFLRLLRFNRRKKKTSHSRGSLSAMPYSRIASKYVVYLLEKKI
jgi:hypothetical protein